MKVKTLCPLVLLMAAWLVASQPVFAQSNPVCAGVSSKVFVNWPEFHSDPCHTGYNRNEFLLGPVTVGNLTLDWQYATGDMLLYSSPAVVNGVVYVGSYDKNLYALNATTGALIWKYTTGGVVLSSPAVVNGVVYVGSDDNNVYALNAATGALLWKYTADGGVESSPTVVNGVVYVGANGNRKYSGEVYALSAVTGAQVWEHESGGSAELSSPAVVNGVVYIGYFNGALDALNAATGELLWEYATGYGFVGGTTISPTVANGLVYTPGFDTLNELGRFDALDAATGELVWRFTANDNEAVASSPAVANGVVYVGTIASDHSGSLLAFDATTGAPRWGRSFTSGFLSSPAVANGVVYAVPSGGDWYALNAETGAVLFEYGIGSTYSSPAVANGVVYITGGYSLWALHLPSPR